MSTVYILAGARARRPRRVLRRQVRRRVEVAAQRAGRLAQQLYMFIVLFQLYIILIDFWIAELT